MTIHRRVAGEVHYNDGQLAEIQLLGAGGIEKAPPPG